jgi:phospholipid/cholesterol/gamma-HCH transport system substrate-binding protein
LKQFVTPFRVGLLVLAAVGFLLAFLVFVRRGTMGVETITVYAMFRDASGLGTRSRVQVAGIPVGEIRDIALVGTRARVTLRLRRDIGLRTDATLIKRTESFLGDYLLDLQVGSPDAPPMPDGGEIIHVIDQQGLQALFDTLGRITTDIQSVTAALREALGGDAGTQSLQTIVRNLTELSQSVNDTAQRSSQNIEAILENVRDVTSSMRSATEGEASSFREIVENVRVITGDVRRMVADVQANIYADGGPQAQMASIGSSLRKLDATLGNLEAVTENIREGRGAVGEVVSDEKLGRKVGETIEDVSDYAQRLTALKVEVNIHSDYLFNAGAAKLDATLRIIARPDKYYLISLISDPRGVENTEYVQTNPPSQGDPALQKRTVTSINSLKFSAQFAKRFYFTTFRFGIIESSGGVGVDFHLWRDQLTLKTDIFDFANQQLRWPRVRTSVQMTFLQHLYLNAGVDDVFNRPIYSQLDNRVLAGRDFFLGAGVVFTDDDFKALIPVVPAGTVR